MTGLLAALGVVAFVLAILVSIGLHEVGHMVPAKRFGGKVTQYFIGFGRTVWSRRAGETEYGLKAFPLGGYVKIVGMLPPGGEGLGEVEYDADGTPHVKVRKTNTGMFAQLVSDARAAEWEHIHAEDVDRLFYKMPWWKKATVMAAGPTVNVLIAFAIFTGVFATYGNPNDHDVAPVVSDVLDCVVPYAEEGRACTPDDPVTPAKKAGLQVGDRFLEVNGVPVTTWPALQEQIRANQDGTAEIVVLRDGEKVTVRTSTTVTALPTSPTDQKLTQVGFLGVVPRDDGPHTGGPLYTLDQMGTMTVETVKALGSLPAKVWGVALAIAGVQERQVDSPVSIVGGGRIAGEVTAEDSLAGTEKAVFLLLLVAGFNLFIGLFNFIPLLPLDGGHIAGALYEAVRRGVARLRNRPDPGYVDVAKLLPVAYVVGAAMLIMGVVLIVGDIVVPVRLT
ncbi:MAG TPA: site-2 protease family protein [Nocardioides sp.]|uniref:M50 family metallopeptidase n=1 Tax=Nocardioides sp. TaxID=35761 RepID=UPI002C18FB00|nr:site-2 protease family protein [Nocardioides sp.]HQR25700.1 site-2 protease family protein [Nocardioides sp.]